MSTIAPELQPQEAGDEDAENTPDSGETDDDGYDFDDDPTASRYHR